MTIMERFNKLSNKDKRQLFFNVLCYMIKYQRNNGWIEFAGDGFLFFDSKPNYFPESFEVTIENLKKWIEKLK